jgi:DNA repair exonuclease SbcCD ATPase subunit
MNDNILMLGASIAIAMLAFIYNTYASYLFKKKRSKIKKINPGEQIQQIISGLSTFSDKIDYTIKNVAKDIEHRQIVLEELKARHSILSQEEEKLSKRVQALKDLPLETAKHFQQISEQTLQRAEKKRTKRDILIFILGIVVTTIISILLKVIWVG